MLCEPFTVIPDWYDSCCICTYTHSHYVIYVVETDVPPDTSTIPDPNSDTDYIAIAASAAGRAVTFTEDIGDGRSGTLAVPGGNDVVFNNEAVGGREYLFVRLYSSVVRL